MLEGTFSSDRVIAEFHKLQPTLGDTELRDVIDVGLRVLAGRVRATPSSQSNHAETLKKYHINEYFDLFSIKDGRPQKTTVCTLDLTVAGFDLNRELAPHPKPKNSRVGRSAQTIQFIEEMREKRFTGTLEQYLKTLF